MIDFTHDQIDNKLGNTMDISKESSTTTYLESHKHLVELYLDYLLRNYTTDEKEQA